MQACSSLASHCFSTCLRVQPPKEAGPWPIWGLLLYCRQNDPASYPDQGAPGAPDTLCMTRLRSLHVST